MQVRAIAILRDSKSGVACEEDHSMSDVEPGTEKIDKPWTALPGFRATLRRGSAVVWRCSHDHVEREGARFVVDAMQCARMALEEFNRGQTPYGQS